MANRNESKRLLREGLWATVGQGVGAVATLAGVRLLTEITSPSLYGTFVLMNGMLALWQGVALQPPAQAALRFYPDYEAAGAVLYLRRRLATIFSHRWQLSTAICFVAAMLDALTLKYLSTQVWALVVATAGLDAWKTVEIVMRNAARRHMAYAILLAADAIARPAGAVLAAWLIGPSLESLLFGQAMGSFAVLVGMAIPARRMQLPTGCKLAETELVELGKGMDRFAAPLFWLPLIGWVSGMADRYIVGGLLGMASAGIYGAVYGLASRPSLLIGAITDATLRQPLYTAALGNQCRPLYRILGTWLGVNVGAGTILALLFGFAGNSIARWFLAAEYRTQAVLLFPWIVAGYVFVLANQVLERVLFAYHRTSTVTLVEMFGAVLAIAGALIGSAWFGIKGVAIAVPFYFGLQLAFTTLLALRLKRNH